MQLFDELTARGLIAQTTDEAEIRELIDNGRATFYVGFDPTADSLHVGHFMALSFMRRLQLAGNRPIALVGGGTGMIGDPSGRTDMRKMMTIEMIDENCERFKVQMSRFLDFIDGSEYTIGTPKKRASWTAKAKRAVDSTILNSSNYDDFVKHIRKTGWIVDGNKYKNPDLGQKKSHDITDKTCSVPGEREYTVDAITQRIEALRGEAIMANNADWLRELNYVEFIRDIGAHFSVNRMLTAECYKQRLEKGLSFLEFNYMIMQSYDFYELYQRFGCNMQLGGDDQWSNMLGGTELIRRKLAKDAYAMTFTLLPSASGAKMGKTAGGAVWLDANKTSPYELYQYFRNVDDGVVVKYLKMLTFLPLEQIADMEKWEGSQLNDAKETLAYELTALVHGTDEAAQARDTARTLFASGGAADMPTTNLAQSDLVDGSIDILGILHKSGLCASRSDARRAVEQGGIEVDGERVTDIATAFDADALSVGIVVRRGKKNYRKITLSA
ncbi:MAG: tyrosine--tRNA ligase [Oscillospiraceae bacterium]|jgi:tyrosyl-tRNA synthetase|nr:tyrosine--tRNA ligase [Oscillospiraceae bacterium]